MKKLVCFIITAALIVTSTTVAFAKPSKYQEVDNYRSEQKKEKRIKSSHKDYKFKASSVIKYGRFILPLKAVTRGMGATATYDKTTAVLTVEKGTITLVIDLKNKTVMVNGVADIKSGIFTAKNSKKTYVLIKYIANTLGVRINVGKDKVTVEIPGLDLPKNITLTPTGSNVVQNTLNSSTLYMEATADINPGQATGGRAELYVGSKLIATDTVITATCGAIQFTTSDGTPTVEELRAAVPEGGTVTVKLYNANNDYVVSKLKQPLIVDYVAPTLTAITSAVYLAEEGELYLNVIGAGALKDVVDVTKLQLYDTTLAKHYQLTADTKSGSKGIIKSATSIKISLGATDKLGLASFSGTTVTLTVAAGSLISDAAGNVSPISIAQTIPVIVIK